MEAKKKKVLLITSALTILVGAGVYVWYTMFRDPNKNNTDLIPPVEEDPKIKPVSSNTNSSQNYTNSSVQRPSLLSTVEALKTFQKWVIQDQNDTSILGGGGSTGYGDDGIWGSKSKSAWNKYGSAYTIKLSGAAAPAAAPVAAPAAAPVEDKIKYSVGTMVYGNDVFNSIFDSPETDPEDRDGYIWLPNALGTIKNYTLNDKGEVVYEITLATPLRNDRPDGTNTVWNFLFNPNAKTGWVLEKWLTNKRPD